jgi:hypothetical protein
MKSTINGKLNQIPEFELNIPEAGVIKLRSLPELGDSKQASYNSENIIGRSFPLYTYSHSGDRSISLQLHFFIIEDGDARRNISDLRKIQSAVYPRPGARRSPAAEGVPWWARRSASLQRSCHVRNTRVTHQNIAWPQWWQNFCPAGTRPLHWFLVLRVRLPNEYLNWLRYPEIY